MKEEHLETQETEAPPAGHWLRQNLDLLATALAALLFLAHFAGWLFPLPRGSREADAALRHTHDKVVEALGTRRYDADTVISEADAAVTRVRSGFGRLPTERVLVAKPFTYPASLLESLRRGETNEIRFKPPERPRLDAAPGSITVTWVRDPDNNVHVSGYALLRSEGDGPLLEIAQLDGETSRYEDKDVKPGIAYTYRVVAKTNDPMVRAQRERSEPSDKETVEAMADFKLALVGADKAGQTATFNVEKWREATWWSKRFTVKVGQTIGEADPGSGVDYATRRTLAALDFESRNETKVRHEIVFDAEGKVKLEGGSPVTEEVSANDTVEVASAKIEGGGLPSVVLTLEKR